jgi:hypothetical protein
MDVFSEDDAVNQELFVITRRLTDVEVSEVTGCLWEKGKITRKRRALRANAALPRCARRICLNLDAPPPPRARS